MERTQTKCYENYQAKYNFSLIYITNLSFQTGVFARELKIANGVPILKAGDEMVVTIYRPESVVPVFSKILEWLMFNRLIEYINENTSLYKYQLGFQKGKSTYMAVLTLVDKISEALNNGDCVIGVFLDFSKTFDTVDHDIKKLENMSFKVRPWTGSQIICQTDFSMLLIIGLNLNGK